MSIEKIFCDVQLRKLVVLVKFIFDLVEGQVVIELAVSIAVAVAPDLEGVLLFLCGSVTLRRAIAWLVAFDTGRLWRQGNLKAGARR